jgi:ankyrin repeat protein
MTSHRRCSQGRSVNTGTNGDPNGRGKPHGTALHAAAAFGFVQITQILLDRGADSLVLSRLSAALSFEKRGNLPMTSHRRCSQGRSVNTPLRAATMRGHREVAALLKRQGGT